MNRCGSRVGLVAQVYIYIAWAAVALLYLAFMCTVDSICRDNTDGT